MASHLYCSIACKFVNIRISDFLLYEHNAYEYRCKCYELRKTVTTRIKYIISRYIKYTRIAHTLYTLIILCNVRPEFSYYECEVTWAHGVDRMINITSILHTNHNCDCRAYTCVLLLTRIHYAITCRTCSAFGRFWHDPTAVFPCDHLCCALAWRVRCNENV